MRHYLDIRSLDITPVVEIDAARFEALRDARTRLVNALHFEEIFDLLVSNHADFERELADIAVSVMLRFDYGYLRGREIRASLCRRLANLLTAGRIYEDQAPRLFRHCINDRSATGRVKGLLAGESEKVFSYRFMLALRDHVQHYAVAIDSVQFGNGRDRETGHTGFNVTPYITKASLAENTRFPSSVVLAEMPDKLDARRAAREYVGAIAKVHDMLRKAASETIEVARSAIEEAIAAYAELLGRKPVGLEAVRESDGRREVFSLLLDWDDTRVWLSDRNRHIVDLGRHYVTTELSAKSPWPADQL